MTQYIHSSMCGTFLVECEIIKQVNEWRFLISFDDPYTDENTVREVDKRDIIFPSFSELVM